MEDEELELDEGVMQQLLHDNDSSTNDLEVASNSSDDDANDTSPNYIYDYTPSKQQLLLQHKSLNIQQMKHVETINEAASQLFHVLHKYGGDTSSSGWEDMLSAENSPWKDNFDDALEEIVAARENMIQAWDAFHNDDVDDRIDGKRTENNDADGEQSKMKWWEPILRPNKELGHNNDTTKAGSNCNLTNDNGNDGDDQQFNPVYLEYAANAFATELEALRKGTLEQICTKVKNKKKGAGGKESTSQPMELDLDPTQHSFVVASSERAGSNNDDGGAKAAAAAAAEIDVQVLSDMLSSGSHSLSNVERNMLLKARQRGNKGGTAASMSDGLSLHERRRQELGLL